MWKSAPWHLTQPSPWPPSASLGVMGTGGTAVSPLARPGLAAASVLLSSWVSGWSSDVVRDSSRSGRYPGAVPRTLLYGTAWMIVSEGALFGGLLWSWYHGALGPGPLYGSTWPPVGLSPAGTFPYTGPGGVPLGGTCLLLASGGTLGHALAREATGAPGPGRASKGPRAVAPTGWALTVLLGSSFTALQAAEYLDSRFTLSDGPYGSTFYLGTGLHGAHVVVGTGLLLAAGWRALRGVSTALGTPGALGAAWYWHFVDVVWLVLYLSLYWW